MFSILTALRTFWKQYKESSLPLDHMWFCLKAWAVQSRCGAKAHFDPGDFLCFSLKKHSYVFHLNVICA